MRLVRIGALVGSVILLVATIVSMVNQRAQQQSEQNARVVASVQFADQAIDSTILRAAAVVDVATAASDPGAMITSFGANASACVVSASAEQCTGADLAATAAFGGAVSASVAQGGPVAVVDEATDSVLVVARDGNRTAVVQLPVGSLIGPVAVAAIRQNDAAVSVELSVRRSNTVDGGVDRVGPDVIDGQLVVIDTLGVAGDGGSVVVTASVADDAGLAGDGLGLYVTLLALGTLLMALAGWTFLIDRRSLERQATTDDLTGLPNRRDFERVTDEALLAAERFTTGVCVMLIDLNGFKQINDTLGHQVGDLVLRAAANRLRDAVRDTDVVGRWGGDEFVILLPGIQDASAVRSSAERIGGLLSGTPITGDITVNAAIGAALFPRHGTTLDDLIRAADEAMYEAKITGVTHRLADPLSSAVGRDIDAGDDYKGPDRRRTTADDNNRV